MRLQQPLIEQRADPCIYKHSDGFYYFTASVPAYDLIELRRARTINELAGAPAVAVWHKPDSGPYSELIWAPEIHFNQGAWYIYFAAAPSRDIKNKLFQHRMYVLRCTDANPVGGQWQFVGQLDSGIDSFCLDATTFSHHDQLYYVWAQKDNAIEGNSNLYIATMDTPDKLNGTPVMLSKPELEWETRGFWVNEGPAVLKRNGKIFLTYSASATNENYCIGLLWADENADLLNPASWHKSPQPVFQSCFEHGVYGPGHNSFTVSEDGRHDMLVYHARTYTEIVGDPLWDPNRHTYIKAIRWDDNGMPLFGKASEA
ncbi:family 43 glycosylhydrolase [Rheinheimera sp. YQF-2]|uniref:Family 43 glycosylhydrolase n=1 Tax=Rheinheimera lutimaris TaxID=2740584 RepID=A0A7Y5AMG5_9GAMM|nr:family 43 glycosylhydrolase [Rheinheimera lutimaris]